MAVPNDEEHEHRLDVEQVLAALEALKKGDSARDCRWHGPVLPAKFADSFNGVAE